MHNRMTTMHVMIPGIIWTTDIRVNKVLRIETPAGEMSLLGRLGSGIMGSTLGIRDRGFRQHSSATRAGC